MKHEIKKLKAITDICPTCGQKIPGAKKPDTTEKENILAQKRKDLQELEERYQKAYKSYTEEVNNINNNYKTSIDNLNEQITVKTNHNQKEDSEIKVIDNSLLTLKQNKAKAELDKQNYLKEIKDTEESIKTLNADIEKLKNNITVNRGNKDVNDNHLNVLSQMMTLIKRDFRGFLLSNIITYIDAKAKEYAQDIFGSNELEFKLDGNNIDIVYCNKMFESLSGGEKQKVDLIIQFAIRDMMSQYLDFSSNILILDEITDNLDAIGCNNVLNLISTKLNDIESIFIISHHASELAIPSDSEMVIVKDRNGISRVK